MKYGTSQFMAENGLERARESGGDARGEAHFGLFGAKRSFSGLLAAAAACVFLFAGAAHATCAYCGSPAIGHCDSSPCVNAEYGRKSHKHSDWGPDKCMYCGSGAYGSGCSFSPHGKHEHGSGGNKCRFCGFTTIGPCSLSPSGRHQR